MKLMLFSFLILILFGINLVMAVNLGISPASVSFKNVLRNGYAERFAVISIDSEEFVSVQVDTRGDIKDWLNYSEGLFNVSRDNPYFLQISVTPPLDTPNGNYSGFLRVQTEGIGRGIDQHAVGIVRPTLDLIINVEVTDIEVIECSVTSLSVDSAEQGDDIIIHTEIQNNGNVRLRPNLVIDLWDPDQISIIRNEEFEGGDILPTTKESLILRVSSSELELGQYWADFLALECVYSNTLTFDVLEEGALKASGVLTDIVTRKTAQVGETIPILAKFSNTGEKEIEAQFRGRINRGNRIIQILESDPVLIPVGSNNNFNFYFTPENAGRYVVSGRVYYSGKKTFESSAILDVVSVGFNFNSIIGFIYILFVILIAYLIYNIRKERKSYLKKLRRIKNEA